jgi:MFS family permease
MQEFPVRRNTALLAAAIAMNSATLQLVAAVSSLTFVFVTGVTKLLGLGPAVSLIAASAASFPAGRLMDRVGRVPVLAGGYGLGAVGATCTGLGVRSRSGWLVIIGFILMGAAGGIGGLARAAAGDMYPPDQRARGIAFTLFGAVVGAILGPSVFAPLFRGRPLSPDALAIPWFAGAAMQMVAVVIVTAVRPDPKRIAEAIEARLHGQAGTLPRAGASLRELLQRPGIRPALIAGVFSFAVMSSIMNLTGYVIVQHRHHPQHLVFPIIGGHVLGMYLLMPVVGWVVDRVGRGRTLAVGLLVIAVSTGSLAYLESIVPFGLVLFGLGLGWYISFVSATTLLADLAAPSERGKLLGFNDLMASLVSACFVLLGGAVLDGFGVAALAFGASLVALAPVAFILLAMPSSDRRASRA